MKEKQLTIEQKQGLRLMCQGFMLVNEFTNPHNVVNQLLISGKYTFENMQYWSRMAAAAMNQELTEEMSYADFGKLVDVGFYENSMSSQFLYQLAFYAADVFAEDEEE